MFQIARDICIRIPGWHKGITDCFVYCSVLTEIFINFQCAAKYTSITHHISNILRILGRWAKKWVLPCIVITYGFLVERNKSPRHAKKRVLFSDKSRYIVYKV